jgi:recombination protein RecT
VGGRHYAMASESNFEMYARKVALLQVLKYMPSSIELANAITVSHAAEQGQSAVIEGDFVTVSTETVDQETGEVKTDRTTDRQGTPPIDAAAFDKRLEAWRTQIAEGMPAADVLATIATRYTLSAEQRAQITA